MEEGRLLNICSLRFYIFSPGIATKILSLLNDYFKIDKLSAYALSRM